MGSKLLIIYGEQAQLTGEVNPTGPDYKSFNAIGVLQAAGLRTFVATSGTAARTALADAVAAAEQGTTAALLLPVNVQHAEIEAPAATRRAVPGRARRPPSAQAIAAAAEVLRASKKPIIVAGRGPTWPARRRRSKLWPNGPAPCSSPRPRARACFAAIPSISASSARSPIRWRGGWWTRRTAPWSSAPG